jgi:hypothetical protein
MGLSSRQACAETAFPAHCPLQKLRDVLARETADGARLSKETAQLALGEAFIEYTSVQLFGFRDETLRLTVW